MDLFVTKTGSLKAGNISGARIMKITVDLENEKIEHYIQHEVRDSEGDLVALTRTYENIELTAQEFNEWITQAVVDATVSRIDGHLNP